MQWRKQIYIDTCGLCSTPKLFNILAGLLSWIAIRQGVSCILHYLDDFLLVDPPQLPICQQNLDTFIRLCSDLGIHLASEKIEGPTTSLSFLEIIIDTHCMEIRLSDKKIYQNTRYPWEVPYQEECHQTQDPFTSWSTPACHNSGEMSPYLHI